MLSNIDDNLSETILNYTDLYVKENPEIYSQEKFITLIFNSVYELTRLTLGEIIDINDPNLVDIIYENIHYYFKTCGLPRSYDNSSISKINIEEMEKKVLFLQSLKQPEQKSREWFMARWTMLTASSIWQALDTQSAQNRLICKKCAPVDINKCFRVNINSPLHHGQKFEPISAMFYENLYKTNISDFGCLRHRKYPFLGASPDGINTDKCNPRYGRMLEIKNIVNREITGSPKKAYWIQMQMQMEVWDLDECDFLETRFKEYENEEEFLKDGGYDCSKVKGVILCFHSRGGPVYKYSPFLAICEEEKCRKWMDDCLESNNTMTWTQNIYWCLDEFSCILVPRNRIWFASALPKFKALWDTILYDREHGYDHRKPKKRVKANNIILKVRTESFNETIIPKESADLTVVQHNS